VHFVVFVDTADHGANPKAPDTDMHHLSPGDDPGSRDSGDHPSHFEPLRRQRYVASVREVVDAEGLQVISNEVYQSDRSLGTVSGAPFRSATLDELVENGFEPSSRRADLAVWR
jgi:hypothetical protein